MAKVYSILAGDYVDMPDKAKGGAKSVAQNVTDLRVALATAEARAIAATDGTDTAAFSGDIAHDGTLAATESADTAALIGDVSHVGTLTAAESADTVAFAGDIGHAGALAATDAADTFAADGAVTGSAATITGDLAASDEVDIASMEGLVETISSSPPFIGRGGGGYLVELDAKPKRETITLYDEEAEILELLAAIMPVIQAQQQRRSTI